MNNQLCSLFPSSSIQLYLCSFFYRKILVSHRFPATKYLLFSVLEWSRVNLSLFICVVVGVFRCFKNKNRSSLRVEFVMKISTKSGGFTSD